MSQVMQELLSILDLDDIEDNMFRGRSPAGSWQRVFGGQVISQALVAAQRTVTAERICHSLHCYFLLPGDPAVPIDFRVDRLRDGGSFTTRQVTASQRGEPIFSMQCSFQVEEHGMEHQRPMPLDVPPPESLSSQPELLEAAGHVVPETVRRFWARERPIHIRPVVAEHYTSRERLPPRQDVWLKLAGPVPRNGHAQRALLAYMSDMTLLDTSTFAHGRIGFDPQIQMASLNHAMWFHRAHQLDDWLLYTQDSPNMIGSRGFSRGFLYSRDGRLIASTAQEGLVRLRTLPTK